MGTQDSYRADRRRARARGARPARRQSWSLTMASTRCSSTGISEAASKGTMESTLSSGSYRQTATGAEWRKSRLSTENCPQKGQDFPNYQPGHTAAAALPGLATWPPAPQGYVRHYQKQHLGLESSFSFFSFFFCSKGKELYGKSRRAMEVSVPQG